MEKERLGLLIVVEGLRGVVNLDILYAIIHRYQLICVGSSLSKNTISLFLAIR